MRQISPELRKRILWVHGGPALFGALICWCLYLTKAVFGIDVIDVIKRRESDGSTTLYLYLALIATVVAAAHAFMQVRKALRLATNGIEVTGTVMRIGKVAVKGLVKVDCSYSYDGTSFNTAWSELKDTARQWKEGEPVSLIVDPNDPARCMPRDEVLGTPET